MSSGIFKHTEYFNLTKERSDRKIIKDDWILETIKHPQKIEIQNDGRIRKWKYIDEVGKYLRIILLEDGITVHNAFLDRNFKEE